MAKRNQTTTAATQGDTKNNDQSATAAAPAALSPSPLNAATRGVLVLFPYKPRSPEDGKDYPVMKGHIDTATFKIPVSAFMRLSEEGRQLLQLSIGAINQERIGGVMLRAESQNVGNGKWELLPGKEKDRFGTISKSVKVGPDEYVNEFELRIYGTRKESAAGVPYIRARIAPVRVVAEDAGNVVGLCF